MTSLTHFDAQGQAHMVDVAGKPATRRIAVAGGRIVMQRETLALVESGTAKKGDVLGVARIAVAGGRIVMQRETLALVESGTAKKGDVLGVARIAGIQAAKKTAELIPLCHPLALTRVAIEFAVVRDASAVDCTATVETVGPTGVEMEALTAVQVALLTVYDMRKAVDRGMTITDVRVREKHGGKSGSFVNP